MILLSQANALRIPLADESVHMVCTSPPYWGLRSYSGNQSLVWGGVEGCQHEWDTVIKQRGAGGEREYGSYDGGTGRGPAPVLPASAFCRRCQAWYGALGLEPLHDCLGWATGELCNACYVCHIVQVFQEVKRILRNDGTCWIVIGDSYTSQGGQRQYGSSDNKTGRGDAPGPRIGAPGLKPKDLVGIPWLVALALRADG